MLIASALLLFYNYDFILGAFPLYVSQLGGSSSEIGLLMGAFSGASFLARPLLARMADRRGLGAVVQLAALTGIVGPLLYLVTSSIGWLALLRAVHAVMPAGFIMAIPLMLVDRTPADQRGRALGTLGAATSSSLLIAPTVGITLLQRGGMPLVVAFSMVAALVALCLLRAVRDQAEDRLTIASQERAARLPTQDPTAPDAHAVPLLRNWPVLSILCVNFTVTLNFGMAFTFAAVHGTSLGLTNPGLFFTAFALGSTTMRLISGQAIDRLGVNRVGIPGFSVLLIGLAALATATGPYGFFGGAFLMGLGHGTCQTLLWAQLVQTATEGRAMAAAGMTNAFDIGIILGSVVGGQIAEHLSFTWMYAGGAAVSLLGATVWIIATRRVQPRVEKAGAPLQSDGPGL